MEVTAYNDDNQSVVIGGKRKGTFRISTSAEFVEILSSALYSNPLLAAIREPICNAWDAHIAAGCTDIPIEVTVTPTKIIIKDFGAGIHDDEIEDVFCSYGESTKRQAIKQTGGFGLGSKAPFAIVEQFEVISCHNGVKSVYSMLKSTEESDGLPVPYLMHTEPTTETGITVEFEHNRGEAEIYAMANSVIYYGEMKAKLNDELCDDKLELKTSELPFIVTSEAVGYTNSKTSSGIFIQYGSVVYPVRISAEYEKDFYIIKRILESRVLNDSKLPSIADGNIILKSEPSSLAIAPSREELSYNQRTVETLSELLGQARATLETENKKWDIEVISSYKQTMLDFLEKDESFPERQTVSFSAINSFRFMGTDKSNEQRKVTCLRSLHKYIDLPTRMKTKNRAVIKYFCKNYLANLKKKRLYASIQSFQDEKRHNAYTFLSQNTVYKRLLSKIYSKDTGLTVSGIKINYNDTISLNKSLNDFDYSDAIDGILVANSLAEVRYIRNKSFLSSGRYILIRPTAKNRKTFDPEQTVKLLAYWSYNAVNVTSKAKLFGYGDKSNQPVKPKAPVAKGSRTGYWLLKDCMDNKGKFDEEKLKTATRIKDPEAVMYLRTVNYKKVPNITAGRLETILELLPKTVILSSYTSYQNLVNKGIPDANMLAVKKAADMLSRNETFCTNIAIKNALEYSDYYTDRWSNLISLFPSMRQGDYRLPSITQYPEYSYHIKLYDKLLNGSSTNVNGEFACRFKTKCEHIKRNIENISNKEAISKLQRTSIININSINDLDPIEDQELIKALDPVIQQILKG